MFALRRVVDSHMQTLPPIWPELESALWSIQKRANQANVMEAMAAARFKSGRQTLFLPQTSQSTPNTQPIHKPQTGGVDHAGGGGGGGGGATMVREESMSSITSQSAYHESKLYAAPTMLPLPGHDGLHTSVNIKALDWIAEYRGERLNSKQMDERYGDELAPYAVSLNFSPDNDPEKTITIDAADATRSSIARYANDILPETIQYMEAIGDPNYMRCQINARFVQIPPNRVFIRATRNIPAHHEIFVSYRTSTPSTSSASSSSSSSSSLATAGGMEEYWGTLTDQARTAVLEYLSTCAPLSGATSDSIISAVTVPIQLVYGDPNMSWKRISGIVHHILDTEIAKHKTKSCIRLLTTTTTTTTATTATATTTMDMSDDRYTDKRLYALTLDSYKRFQANRARTSRINPAFPRSHVLYHHPIQTNPTNPANH